MNNSPHHDALNLNGVMRRAVELLETDFQILGIEVAPFLEPRRPPAMIIHDRRTEEIETSGHLFLQRPVTEESLRRTIREALR